MGSVLKKTGMYASSIGQGALCIGGMFILLLIAALMLRGIVWVADKALPLLLTANTIAIFFCVVVLVPLSLFKKTRPWAGVAFYVLSFFFGLVLLSYSCVVVVELWGYTGLVIGLILGGVGVVPVALLAALFHAEWSPLLSIIISIALTFGSRFLGMYLSIMKPALVQQAEQEQLFERETASTFEER